MVRSAHLLSGGSAGARTVASIVSQRGEKLTRYVASGLMKELGLVSNQLPKHAYKRADKRNRPVNPILNSSLQI